MTPLPLLLLACQAYAQQPVSGQYGPLLIAAAEGRVHGVFVEAVGGVGPGGAPQFLCATLLDGKVTSGSVAVQAWLPDDPERISGELTLVGDSVLLRLDENPPGCAMASNLAGGGQHLPRSARHADWTAVGLVTAERAILHRQPAANDGARMPYLVEWDAVAIIERQGDRVLVEYVGGAQPIRGWLNRAELAIAGEAQR